jgi:tetratricopeptide (TPR) repeat protein
MASAGSAAQALEEYLAAAEAGTAPPRQQLLERYPELADDLDACLAALNFIGRAVAGPRSIASSLSDVLPAEQDGGQLGDFRLIREVGRGGMGVVYEAEQLSLGRRVALKVLPFAATMDPRQLQRFHNEARAAALLDHPHIVHVHAVGCERAVHFYAMQFIDGQTLAALIVGLRRSGGRPVTPQEQATTPYVGGAPAPSADTVPRAAASTERAPLDRGHFRRVAEMGIQAAEALDHAHALGILHRDVKPGNLLVDGRGGVWVTDFGLAHMQSDAHLTMTGDLVGTLRYMSPEQALAKRVVVDHRTDVYSLGATLYELLTLEPAFGGNDRQELLRQIAFEEPKAPRRLNRTVPAELETIVLKAMEKNPAERYATAKELADDLRRFLDDKPIRARRPSLLQQARRWSRRHQSVVWSMALIALILAASLGWILGDRHARQAEAELRVEEALAMAEASLPRGNPHDAELVTAARKAEAHLVSSLVRKELRQRVERVLADLSMLAKLEEVRLDQALVRDGHFDMARADPAYAQAFRDYGIDVEVLSVDEAGSRIRECAISLHLAAALDGWALARRDREKEGSPNGEKATRGHSTWKRLLEVAQVADPDHWRVAFRQALANNNGHRANLEKLAASASIDKLPATTLELLGKVLRNAGAIPQAVEVLRQGQQRYPDDFWINHDLAFIAENYIRPPQLDEAISCYRAALALRPHSPGVHLNFGYALEVKGQLDRAIALFRKAVQLKPDYADAYLNLGAALHRKGRPDEAIAAYREALRVKPDFAEAHNNLGAALDRKGQTDSAMAEFREALRLKKNLPEAHVNLGDVLRDKRRLDEAIAEYREAIRLRKNYVLAHIHLGIALRWRGQMDEAVAELRKATRLEKDNPDAHFQLGNVLNGKGQQDEAIAELRKASWLKKDFPDAHYNLGNILRDKGQLDDAIAEYREAIRLKKDDADYHRSLGYALGEKGQLDEAIGELQKAIDLDPKHASTHAALGQALCDKKDAAGAIAELQKAINLDPKLSVAHGILGQALAAQGRFAEALAAERRCLELRPNNELRELAEQAIREYECLIELDSELPAILSGKKQPANNRERADYADLCQKKRLYASAAHLYEELIKGSSKLVAAPSNNLRYNAACAAAQAGCGQGMDARTLNDQERANLLRLALDWLQAELTAWRQLLEKDPVKNRPVVQGKMRHWQQDKDFACVRGADGLSQLPQAERLAWKKLWQEVEALRKSAAASK